MAFSILKNYSGNYLSFSGLLSDMYYLKQTQEGAPRKELLQKRDKEKGEEW